LVQAGHERVFLDADRADGIQGGRRWEIQLYAELRGTGAMACLVSASYVASQMVRRRDGHRPRPWRLGDPVNDRARAAPPMLEDIQELDYATDPAHFTSQLGTGWCVFADGRLVELTLHVTR
jgi:hypothetical protein